MSRFFTTPFAPLYLRSRCLYERKPVTETWKKLTIVATSQWKWRATTAEILNAKKRVLQIHGPPGTGKSSSTFCWAYNACNCGASVLWINCARSYGRSKCWSINKIGEEIQVSELRRIPDNAAETATSFHIVVFDGVRNSTLEDWRGFFCDLSRRGVFAVVVSSEGVRMHQGDANDILFLNHFVPSWIMDEYEAACASNEFWSQCFVFFDGASINDSLERRKQLLDVKFQVAGQSARFMFNLNRDDVIDRISEDAASMGGMNALEDAVRSDRSAGSVNSLIARTRQGSCGVTPQDSAPFPTAAELAPVAATTAQEFRIRPEERDPRQRSVARLVSSFATEEVINQIPSSIRRLREVARALDNRVIEGYALEEQLKKSLNDARNPGVSLTVVMNGSPTPLPVRNYVECTTYELESLLATLQTPDTWIFVGGQQGAFDALHFVSNDYIRFVQTTAGASHTFYLDIISGLLTRLATNHDIHCKFVEFMVMRPIDDHRPFALKTARGSLYGYTRFDGEAWNRSNNERNNVVHCQLPWDY